MDSYNIPERMPECVALVGCSPVLKAHCPVTLRLHGKKSLQLQIQCAPLFQADICVAIFLFQIKLLQQLSESTTSVTLYRCDLELMKFCLCAVVAVDALICC